MQAGLVPIEHDELARTEAGDLTAKFRTDGSAGSRDQYPLPGEVQGDRGNVNLDLPPTEQLRLGDGADVVHSYRAAEQLPNRRNNLDLDVELYREVGERSHELSVGT